MRTAGRRARVGQVQVVTKSDVQRLQADVLSQASALDRAFTSCLGKLDDATKANWHDMKNRAFSFAGETAPTFFTASAMNAGQAIQRDLQPWYDTFSSAGCTAIPVKPVPPPAPASLLSALGLGDLSPIVMLGLVYLIAREFK